MVAERAALGVRTWKEVDPADSRDLVPPLHGISSAILGVGASKEIDPAAGPCFAQVVSHG